MACAAASSAGAQAPPPPAMQLQSSALLRLELVVNGAPTGRVVPVEQEGGRYLINAQDLRDVDIQLDPEIVGRVDAGRLPGVEIKYDEGGQRLIMRVPGEWLPRQRLGEHGQERIVPQSSFGALLNYDLYATRAGNGAAYANLWAETRMFGAFGVVRSTSTYRRSLSGRGEHRFTRYDTGWTYVDEEHVRTYEAGDLVTRTLPWSNPVRLGGFQISRDFAVRPDIVTYPIPTFSGMAAVPSAVDLFINGYRTAGGELKPGPFTLGDVPYLTGGGEATVVTTDAQGRRVSTTIPFYVANTLLRPGLSDFSFAAGMLRRDYGLDNLSYGPFAASGALRHGVTDWLTLEAQAQTAPSLQLGGVGGVARLGNWGVIDGSIALSRHRSRTGAQTAIGYQYNARRFNIAVSHIRRDTEFADLARYDVDFDLPRRQTIANGSIVLGDELGTLGLGYIDSQQQHERFRLANLSYYKPLWRGGGLLLSANRDLVSGTTAATFQIFASFGQGGSAAASIEQAPGGTLRERVGYNQSVPAQGGFGWRTELAHGPDVQYQADATWRTSAMQVQAGVYGSGGRQTQWSDIGGSLVVIDGGAFLTNRINDAFVLVSTDGVPAVPVRQENQLVGVTNSKGHLLIPWVSAYHGTKFEIDPLDLPAHFSTPVVEQRAAVKLGGGRIVRFPVRAVRSGMLILRDSHGQPLSPGTPVTVGDALAGHVGWDGIVYLEDLSDNNNLSVSLSDGSICHAVFKLPASSTGIAQIGALTCQ